MNNIKPECKSDNKQQTVVHLIFRFDIGGLERVMVNCINAMLQRYDNEKLGVGKEVDLQRGGVSTWRVCCQ